MLVHGTGYSDRRSTLICTASGLQSRITSVSVLQSQLEIGHVSFTYLYTSLYTSLPRSRFCRISFNSTSLVHAHNCPHAQNPPAYNERLAGKAWEQGYNSIVMQYTMQAALRGRPLLVNKQGAYPFNIIAECISARQPNPGCILAIYVRVRHI